MGMNEKQPSPTNSAIRIRYSRLFRYFTLPKSLSGTLNDLGFKKFFESLQSSELLETIEQTPGITVFAPEDASFADVADISQDELVKLIKQHIVIGFPQYTPFLQGGNRSYKSFEGAGIPVSIQNDSYRVGEARISQGNIIITNGVIHAVDKVC